MMETQREYYENGNIEYEIPHKNGKRHGVEKEYDTICI